MPYPFITINMSRISSKSQLSSDACTVFTYRESDRQSPLDVVGRIVTIPTSAPPQGSEIPHLSCATSRATLSREFSIDVISSPYTRSSLLGSVRGWSFGVGIKGVAQLHLPRMHSAHHLTATRCDPHEGIQTQSPDRARNANKITPVP